MHAWDFSLTRWETGAHLMRACPLILAAIPQGSRVWISVGVVLCRIKHSSAYVAAGCIRFGEDPMGVCLLALPLVICGLSVFSHVKGF